MSFVSFKNVTYKTIFLRDLALNNLHGLICHLNPAFPKIISSKMNTIIRLEFELAHFEATVLHFNPCATETPSSSNYSNIYVAVKVEKLILVIKINHKVDCLCTLVFNDQSVVF